MTHYILYWKTQASGDYLDSYTTADQSELSYIITGLDAGVFYDIKVQAFNVVGGSDHSGVVRIVAATVPAQLVAPSMLSQSSTTISISWTEPSTGGSEITEYTVYMKTAGDVTYQQIGVTSAATTHFTKSDLSSPGTEFDFVVSATNAAGMSAQSSPSRIKAADPPGAPDQLEKLFADGTSIRLSWATPAQDGHSPIEGFYVYWNAGGGDPLLPSPIVDTADPLVLTHTFDAPTPGERYVFAVSAYNDIGEGAQSLTIEIIAATVPAKPDPVTRFSSGSTSIGFSWVAPNDGHNSITGYIIKSNGGSGNAFT